MKQCETVILDNNKEYVIIEQINFNNNQYIFLANPNDENDFCIKKIIKKDLEELIVSLDNEEEFNQVLVEYSKNNI